MAASCHRYCQLISGTVSGEIEDMPCGASTTLYQAALNDPPDGTFYAMLAPTSCTITFTFHQCSDHTESRSFTPGLLGDGDGLAVALTVPNVRSITATCLGSGSTCSFEWFFLPHYCRCCSI